MEQINALGGQEFWDTACALWGGARFLRLFAFATPASAAFAMAADITCIGYGISRGVQSML